MTITKGKAYLILVQNVKYSIKEMKMLSQRKIDGVQFFNEKFKLLALLTADNSCK